MGKWLIFSLGVLWNVHIVFAGGLDLGVTDDKSAGGIISTLGLLNEKKARLRDKQSLLDFEKTREFPEEKKLNDLRILRAELENLIEVLALKKTEKALSEAESSTETESGEAVSEISPADDDFGIEKLEAEILLKYARWREILSGEKVEWTTEDFEKNWPDKKIFNEKTREWEKSLAEKTGSQQVLLEKTKAEIEELTPEIERMEKLYRTQLWDLWRQILVFGGIILAILISRKIAEKILEKMMRDLPPEKLSVLIFINKWGLNGLILIALLIFFSAQFMTILPILAILGVALGYGLRDMISSFVAWFVIGLREGFEIGDRIKIGKGFGRVKSITPFLIVMDELGLNGTTGKVLTIPNKKIFEEKIQNWSKLKDFSYTAVEFLLEKDSDVVLARKLLEEAITEGNQESYETAQKSISVLKRIGVNPEKIEPQTFLDALPTGILLRGKIFVDLDASNDVKTDVIEHFMKKIKAEPTVKIRFIEMN